jgi:hypothetical protein
MSILIADLRDSGRQLCDLAADEIETLEASYELLFKENAELTRQLEEARKVVMPDGCDCEPATVYEAFLQQEMLKLMRVLKTLDSAQDPDDVWRLLQHVSAAIQAQGGK